MGWVTVADTQDVPPGRTKAVVVGGKRVLICNVDGQFFAVSDVCTHDNEPLDQGVLNDHQIECPRHGACFDVRTGKVLRLPAVQPIPTFAVQIEGQHILVADQPSVGVAR